MIHKTNIRLLLIATSVATLAFTFTKTHTLNETIKKLKRERKIMILDTADIQDQILKSYTSKEIKLGKKLFNDNILSKKNNISCASCHIPEKGFGNGEEFGVGTHGNHTSRHVPHLYNMILTRTMFWDGRVNTLEEQFEKVLTSKDELDMNFEETINRLKNNTEYRKLFSDIFPKKKITKETITKVIVAYEQTLLTYDSPYDKFIQGDTNALTAAQKRGFILFTGKANCIACHKGANLTDNDFHNVGLITEDIGRAAIDKIGMSNEFESRPYPFFSTYKAFKTPSLRNVELSAPYFHNGSKKTLFDVIKTMYSKGGENPDKTGLAKEIKVLNLEDYEINDLVEFLHAFTSNTQEKNY